MLFVEPYAGSAPVLNVIQSAKKSVDLNVYYLSSRKILSALASAHGRGVSVRVIIDGKPYHMSVGKVQREVNQIEKTGASVQSAPGRFESTSYPYSFDHAKYVCSMHACEIGTANYDYSAFHKNREYVYTTTNPIVVQDARSVFHADWTNTAAGADPRQKLVLSPGSTSILVQVINQTGPVDIESEEMGNDPDILNALERKGGQAHVILPRSISARDQKNCHELVLHGVKIRYMPDRKAYMHAKMIVGSHYAFIGSQNFTTTSLTDNREIGVILNSDNDLSKLHSQFSSDWSAAQSN